MNLNLNIQTVIYFVIIINLFENISFTLGIGGIPPADNTNNNPNNPNGNGGQVNLESDNYDPYDAQAPAVALRPHHVPAGGNLQSPTYHPHSTQYYQQYPSPSLNQNNNNNNNNNNNRGNARLENYDDEKIRNNPNPYDPFYFFGRQRVHGVGTATAPATFETGLVRNRRNSRLYVNNNNSNNDLLNEDVYFFRRKDIPNNERSSSNKDKLKMYENSPYYYRPSNNRPTINTQQPFQHHQQQQQQQPGDSFKFFSNQQPILASSRPFPITNSFENRGYYPPPQSNQIDYYERPRHFDREPLHHRGTIDGWSVQVGTQLQVHDDGRTRNPGQHYVRDERPGSVRGYPYHRDRQ